MRHSVNHEIKVKECIFKNLKLAIELGMCDIELNVSKKEYIKGDILILREYNEESCKYTGRELVKEIESITFSENVLKQGGVVVRVK